MTQKDKRRERYQRCLSSRKALAGSKRVAVAIDGGGPRRSLKGGRADIEICGKTCRAYTHKILPGMVAPEDEWECGTLEVGLAGRAGSKQDKYIQTYDLKLPATMKSVSRRKRGLLNLVDTILSNSFVGNGLRVRGAFSLEKD